MSLVRPSRLIALALFVAAGLLVIAGDGTVLSAANGQKEKKDKDFEKKDFDKKDKDAKNDPGKASKDLHKAFEKITDIAQTPVAGKEATRVFDHAKRFYREALKAYPTEPRRSAELAIAANDALRGLEHLQRANAKPVPGLPEPPTDFDRPPGGPKGKGPPAWNAGVATEPGPWSEALEALSVTRERLSTLDTAAPVNGPVRDLIDAAKTVYGQARTAYEGGEYRKAAELARAAEAWSHVPEHLARAGWELGEISPGAPVPRLKGTGAPPPPPAIPPIKE
jgi:hypothetical protein